jgi:hypothetical protein
MCVYHTVVLREWPVLLFHRGEKLRGITVLRCAFLTRALYLSSASAYADGRRLSASAEHYTGELSTSARFSIIAWC